MPRIKRNTLIKGASGNYRGEYVYKVRGDETFIAAMPERDPNREKTENEKAFRRKSNAARAYARAAIADPLIKAFYEKKVSKTNSAFNVAFRDFQTYPTVDEIVTATYTGALGSKISVFADDDCEVTGVVVSIVSAAGVLIEEGPAVFDAFEGGAWIYTTTQNNPVLAGSKIKATAKDRPSHEGFKEVIL